MHKTKKNLEETSEAILDEAFENAIDTVADEESEDKEEVSENIEESTEDKFEVEETETENDDVSENDNEVEQKTDEESDVVETVKDSDDEFMESITEQKMSPEQAKKKIEFWQKTIENAEERIEELEPIHQVYTNDGLDPVMDEVKKSLQKSVDDENVKDITKNAKLIDAIHIVSDLIRDLNSNYVQNKRDIEKAKSEIERIGTVQLDIFENAEKDSTDVDTKEPVEQSPSTEQTGSEVSEEAA